MMMGLVWVDREDPGGREVTEAVAEVGAIAADGNLPSSHLVHVYLGLLAFGRCVNKIGRTTDFVEINTLLDEVELGDNMRILQSGVDSILVLSMPLLPSDISNSCFSAVKLLRILA